MKPRRRNPLRRYPTAVCISVWHFGLTRSKTRALNSPDETDRVARAPLRHGEKLRDKVEAQLAAIKRMPQPSPILPTGGYVQLKPRGDWRRPARWRLYGPL
jgi:hypothetical protein